MKRAHRELVSSASPLGPGAQASGREEGHAEARGVRAHVW